MFEIIYPIWGIIIKVILNTIFVTLPEQIYLVMFTLILMGEFDYWKEEECRKIINKWDYSRILIPSVTAALLLNIARYTDINPIVSSLACMFLFYGLIVYTNDVLKDARPFKWMYKALILLVIAQITVVIIKMLYIPLVLSSTGKDICEISGNILINFITYLPARLIQFLILAIFVNKKRTLLKGNLLKHIASSPVVSSLTSSVIIFDLLFLYIMNRAIVFGKLLIGIPLVLQITTIVGTILFPVLNITGMVWAIYYNKNNEMMVKRNLRIKLEVLLEEINAYKENDNFSDIRWKLNEMGMAIEEINDDIGIEK